MDTEILSRIEQRLARIEADLAEARSITHQAPALISMAADTMDEMAGTDNAGVDQRLKNGLSLLWRLSDPAVLKSVNGMLDLAEQGPGLISMMADIVDESIAVSNQGEVSLNDRLEGGLSLMVKLTDPKVVKQLNDMVDFAAQAPGLIAMFTDTVDETMTNTEWMSPKLVGLLQKAGEAVGETMEQPTPKVGGIFSMLRTMKDPDRQKAVGLIMGIMKNLGKKL